MADLYNLLDGINESQQEEDHDLGPTLEEGKDESEEWDLQDREPCNMHTLSHAHSRLVGSGAFFFAVLLCLLLHFRYALGLALDYVLWIMDGVYMSVDGHA